MAGKTFILVQQPSFEEQTRQAAISKRFFEECRAAHDAMVERNVAAILAAEAAAEPAPLRLAA